MTLQQANERYNKTMLLIKRTTYRMTLKQSGAILIPVADGRLIDDRETMDRKNEMALIQYNRDNKYSGFDEYTDVS